MVETVSYYTDDESDEERCKFETTIEYRFDGGLYIAAGKERTRKLTPCTEED